MKKNLVLFIFCILIPYASRGQGEDQLLPSELKQLTVITEPVTLPKGFFRLSIHGYQSSHKRYFDDSGKKTLVEGDMMSRSRGTGLLFSYGITDRIQVNSTVPYRLSLIQSIYTINDPQTSRNYTQIHEEKSFGISDIDIGILGQVRQESEIWPSITAGILLELPTGRKEPSNIREDSLYLLFDGTTGDGEVALKFILDFRKIIYPFSFEMHTDVNYGFGGMKSSWPGIDPVSFKSGIFISEQAGINFHLNDWICMTNDLYFDYHGKDKNLGEVHEMVHWNFMWVPHIYFQIRRLRLVQGFTLPITGRNIVADPSYILLVSYVF